MKKSTFVPRFAAFCLAAASAACAQTTTAIRLFGPVNDRSSISGTTEQNPNDFNSTILNLSCTAPFSAKLSSTPDGTGNLLVDNFIPVQIGQEAAQNICTGGVQQQQQNCINGNWYNTGPSKIGIDPDTVVAADGIPPINL